MKGIKKMGNYAVFPQKVCNVSQSWDGTHYHYKNSSGTPADYPMDIVDSTGGREEFYAPCRMKCVKIYGPITGNAGPNGAWFESTEPVDFPDGTTDYLTIKFVHMENDDFGNNGIYVGRIYEKYEYVGREGMTGDATGNHLHVTCGKGHIKNTGWVENSKAAWVLQATNGQFKPDQLLYIDRNFTTMKSEKNMTFQDMPQDSSQGQFEIGKNYRLFPGSNVYDNEGNVLSTSSDMSCVKVFIYDGDSRYFISTTEWYGGENTVQEHGIGWVDESSLEPWSQIHQVGSLVKYWGGPVFSSLNGIENGYPVSGPWTIAKVIDYKEGEHPYFIQDTHNGVYMGWVSEFTIGNYELADVTFMAGYAAGKHGMTEDQKKIYDFTGDGEITLADVMAAGRVVNGSSL